MKNLFTEKNILWAAVLALGVSSYLLHTGSSCGCGDRDEGWRARMGQMRQRMAPRGDGLKVNKQHQREERRKKDTKDIN